MPLAALFAVTLVVLSACAAYLVLVSRDLMIADFMTYRGVAMMIARLADSGNWPLLFSAAVQSITQDYSWAPGLVPGLLLAATEPTSRAVYTFSLLAFYAAPAASALAILAHDCARRADCVQTKPDAIHQPRPEAPRSGLEGRASSHEPWRIRPLRRLLRMRSRVSPTPRSSVRRTARSIFSPAGRWPT